MPPLDHTDPAFAEVLGQAIVATSYHLCGVAFDARPTPGGVIQGFDKLAPIYVKTSEGRDGPGPDQRKHYSSCGDQLHAILDLMGVRAPWVNRGANHLYGTPQMAKLEPFDAKNSAQGSPASHYVPKDPSYRPPPGSLCLIWTPGQNNAHALTILGDGSDANHIRTGNYGAGGMSSATAPGANVADSPCVWDPASHALLIGGTRRHLQCVITPAALAPFISAQIDLTGVTCPGISEIADALGAKFE